MSCHNTPRLLETSFEYVYNERGRESAGHGPAPRRLGLGDGLLGAEDGPRPYGPQRPSPGSLPPSVISICTVAICSSTEHNSAGIIDWSSAPLEQLSISPEFATFPALSDEKNRLMIELKGSRRGVDKGTTERPSKKAATRWSRGVCCTARESRAYFHQLSFPGNLEGHLSPVHGFTEIKALCRENGPVELQRLSMERVLITWEQLGEVQAAVITVCTDRGDPRGL